MCIRTRGPGGRGGQNTGMRLRSDICYHLRQMSQGQATTNADSLLNCMIFKIVSILRNF